MTSATHRITLNVNGTSFTREVESRHLLADFLRHEIIQSAERGRSASFSRSAITASVVRVATWSLPHL